MRSELGKTPIWSDDHLLFHQPFRTSAFHLYRIFCNVSYYLLLCPVKVSLSPDGQCVIKTSRARKVSLANKSKSSKTKTKSSQSNFRWRWPLSVCWGHISALYCSSHIWWANAKDKPACLYSMAAWACNTLSCLIYIWTFVWRVDPWTKLLRTCHSHLTRITSSQERSVDYRTIYPYSKYLILSFVLRKIFSYFAYSWPFMGASVLHDT